MLEACELDHGAAILTELSLTFGASDVEITARERVYQGFFAVDRVTVTHRRFAGGWTEVFSRELFERGDAVAVLPWDIQSDRIILIEQFRAGAIRDDESPWMLEVVAGIVEPGESDQSVAIREAQEEAGCTMDRLEPIAAFYPSAGGCSEQIRLFVGRVTSAAIGEVKGLDDEQEDILVHSIHRSDAIALLDSGQINNGQTLIALQWLARHGDSYRDRWLADD